MPQEKQGFTLIEVLVVVIVLGILAAIAIAKFSNTKDEAYIASMKADLHNFALYEQNYSTENNGAYFAGSGTAQGFVPSNGVTINASVNAGPPASWSAVATHNKTSKTCQVVTTGSSDWNISCP